MKKQLVSLLTIFFTLNAHAQIDFEKGYFIDNDNKKVECLIKNVDWKNNPDNFKYIISTESEIKSADINSVKEFSIYGNSKYLRGNVKMDRSSEELRKLSQDRSPIFREEEVFLRALVEGKASLYIYQQGSLRRFFYTLEDSLLQPLVFKKYKSSDGNVKSNNRFRQQLWRDFDCPNRDFEEVREMEYDKKELTRLFVKYNRCYQVEPKLFEQRQKRDLFRISLRPRLNSSSLFIQNAISNPVYDNNIDLGNSISFGIGIDFEFILPFNKNKWAITLEPTYQNYQSETSSERPNISGGTLITEADYRSIEIPLGLRYFIFLKDQDKIFINASLVFDFDLNSCVEFRRGDNSLQNSLEIETRNNLALGVGYKFKERYNLELRYLTDREILSNNRNWSSDYQTVSLIFGYSIINR